MPEQDNQQPEKIQTRFPGLQAAAGRKPEELEVLAPAVVPGGNDDASAQQQQQQQAQQQKNSEGEQKNNEGGAAAAAKADDAQPAKQGAINLDDLSDEDRDELIAKLTKGKVKTLGELDEPVVKTKDQLAAEAAQRRQDAISWAFDTDKIKREDYDNAVVLQSKSDRELALSAFTASLQADDQDITAEEAAELFKDVYHEGQKEGSPLYKAGQREMKKLADAVRTEKIGVLDQIEPEYEHHMQTQSQHKAFKKQVKTIAEAAAKTVDFAIPYKNVDGTETVLSHSAQVDPAVVNKIVSDLTTDQAFVMRNIATNGKINEKELAAELTYHIKARMFDTVIPQLLETHGKEVEQRLIVALGNKKVGNTQLNAGQQPTPRGAQQKTNSYPGLNAAMKKYQ